MDAKKVLEYMSKYPPQPVTGGCARSALHPFLRSMQLVGAYHENRYYAHFDESEQTGRHYVTAIKGQNDDFLDYSTAKRKSTTLTSDATSAVPQSELFTRTERAPTIFASNVGALKENNNDLRRRDTVSSTAEQAPDYQLPAHYEPLTPESMESIQHPDPCTRSNSFFVRCGILDKELLRKLVVSLGCEHPKSNEKAEDEDMEQRISSNSKSCLRKFWSDRTYSAVFLFLQWANLLRCGMFINHNKHVDVMTILIPILWFLTVTGFSTTLFISSFRRDYFYEFFTKWTILYQDPTTRALGLRGVSTSTATKVSLWTKWSVTIINTACIVFLMCMDDSFSAGMNYPFYLTGQRSTIVIVVSAGFLFVTSATWIGAICFIALLCYFIKKHFWEFGHILQLHISAAGTDFPPALNLLRERHMAMCDQVTVLDRHMRLAVTVALSIIISIGCLQLYQVFRIQMDISVLTINVMWLLWCLLLAAVVTDSMADVSVAMHACSDDLFAIQTRRMTLEQFGQLQMFMTKVNGPSMGFSVLGLVVVTRELMLTLFGVFLTYGIVLLQFP